MAPILLQASSIPLYSFTIVLVVDAISFIHSSLKNPKQDAYNHKCLNKDNIILWQFSN